jgi:hypothetical protein
VPPILRAHGGGNEIASYWNLDPDLTTEIPLDDFYLPSLASFESPVCIENLFSDGWKDFFARTLNSYGLVLSLGTQAARQEI